MEIVITEKWRKQLEAAELRGPKPVATKLTKSAKTLLRFYRSLGQAQFYRSLDRIASESGLTKITVRRANERLRDLGLLAWKQGFSVGERKVPNMYFIKTQQNEHLCTGNDSCDTGTQ